MSDSIAELRSAHPAHLANRPDPEPAAVVDDETWSSLKAEIIRLYQRGKLGPFTVEMLFEAFPELRSA